jgi:hypothetical protein
MIATNVAMAATVCRRQGTALPKRSSQEGGVTDDLAPVNRHMPNAKASIAGNGNAFSGSRATANRPTHACGAVCRHPPATETLPARRKRKQTQTRS